MCAWEEVTLDKLGTLQRGKQRHKPKTDPLLFENGTIPLILMTSVNGNLYVNNIEKHYNQLGLKQSKLFPKETVCITNKGRISSSILFTPACLSGEIVGFNAFLNISDPIFIKYSFDFLKIYKQLFALFSIGEKYLNSHHFLKIFFPNPPLELQQKIGKILSTYDLLIENYENQIELLKKQRSKEASYFKDDLSTINFLII